MATHLSMTVIGRLGNDLKNGNSNGVDFVNMSIAHSIPIFNKEQNEWTERTVWVRATYWGKLEKPENFKKGSLVLVEGTPSADMVHPKDGSSPYASLTMTTFRVPKVLIHVKETQPYATPANQPAPRQEAAVPSGAQPVSAPTSQPTFNGDLPF